MPAKFIYRKKEFIVSTGITIQEALNEINVAPETIILIRNGKLVTDDEFIKDGEIIRLVPVISGG